MNLYDFLRISDKDYDTFDATFDICVTCVSVVESPDNDYTDLFSIALYKVVEVIPEKSTQSHPCVNWAGLITAHYDKFQSFMKKYWITQYSDKDEFIYQWINELHLMLAGNGTDSAYKELIILIESLTEEDGL